MMISFKEAKNHKKKINNNNNDQDIEVPQSTRRSFKMLGLTTFPPFKILLPYESLTFSGNPIDSFLTLPSLPNLKRLDVSDTEINSFQYLQCQPIIESVFIRNTPLFHYNEIILMTVIAFGRTLKKINGSLIPQNIYKRGLEMKPYLFCYLYNGWIILGDDPIKIFNVNTRKRLFFVSLKSIPQIPMNKYNDEINRLSKSYASLSNISTHKQKGNTINSSFQNENNNGNKIKKNVSNVAADRISQSMPRIPTYHVSKKNASKSEQNEKLKKNCESSNQSCKTPRPSHKRNKSQDFRVAKSAKPIIRGSKSHFSKNMNPNSDADSFNNDNCTFKKVTPVCIRKKRRSDISDILSRNSSITVGNSIMINDEDDDLITSHQIGKEINNNQDFTNNLGKSENSENLNKHDRNKTEVLINQTLNNENVINNKNESLQQIKIEEDIKNDENTEKSQIQINFKSESSEDKNEQQLSDKSSDCSASLSESSSSFNDELPVETNKQPHKLSTKILDHSNALNNLSSIKNIYQDLLLCIPDSGISETNEYISDAQIDQQIDKINNILISDSSTTDDFSSAIDFL